jgi:hypothetical protein
MDRSSSSSSSKSSNKSRAMSNKSRSSFITRHHHQHLKMIQCSAVCFPCRICSAIAPLYCNSNISYRRSGSQ